MLFRSLAINSLLATAVLAQEGGAPATPDLTTLLQETPELSNLTTYIGLFPDLAQTLSQLQNVTILAPNNQAFAQLLNSSAGAAITDNDAELVQALLTYHVLTGTYTNFSDVEFIPTALQPPQFTNVTDGQVVGVYPDNDTVRVVSGLLSTANATGEPRNFTGGVVHVIDRVLTIPQNVSETVVQLNFTAAVGALTNANLAETVDRLTDITLFVPSNAAFNAIGSALPNMTMDNLTQILQYHVVEGVVGYSVDLENGTSLMTLQGNNVTITVEDDKVFVNSARVIVPDVLVANGVVHVIDSVLNPANATATADPAQDSGTPAFEGASSASDVPFTSGAPTPTSTIATESAPGATATATSASEAAAMPLRTGAVGVAALFGGAAMVMNM